MPNSGSAVFGLLYAPAKDGRVIIGVYVRKRRPKMEQTGCKCLCEKCAATKTGTDLWLLGNDPNLERYLEFSADFEHYFLFTLDHALEKLTLEYYDKDFSKIWKREFEGTTAAHYDYTKNNIYLSADNSLYIIDLSTGEYTFQPAFIGEKQEIRKMTDGILSVGFTKSDAIMKTDLEGRFGGKYSLDGKHCRRRQCGRWRSVCRWQNHFAAGTPAPHESANGA